MKVSNVEGLGRRKSPYNIAQSITDWVIRSWGCDSNSGEEGCEDGGKTHDS